MRAAVGVGALLVVLGAVPQASSQSSASSKDSASTARAVIRLADEYVRETISTYPEYAFLSGFTLPRHDGLSDNSAAACSERRRRPDQPGSHPMPLSSSAISWARRAGGGGSAGAGMASAR